MVAITSTTHDWQAPRRRHLELVPASARPATQVYARRRLGVALAVLVLVAVTALALSAVRGGSSAVSTETGPGANPVVVHDLAAYGAAGTGVPAGAVYVVRPGDTIWSIAAALHPGSDVRDAVDHLVELNGSAVLQAGQKLHLR